MAIDPTGKGSGYFDRAYSRWLPVARQVVSPDGAHYAYVTMGADPHPASGPRGDQGIFYVHVVDVAGGSDHSFSEDTHAAGIRFQPFVFDYASEGIYLSQGFYSFASDLWLVNPLTGSIRHVSNVGGLQVSAGGGVFWSGEVNPADPHPVASGTAAGNLPDQIDRLDLKTGSVAPWLYWPGYELAVVGVDIQGDPLIRAELGLVPPVQGDYVDPAASELLIALDATSLRMVYKGQLAGELYGAIADSHGVWFADLAWSNEASGRYGIYLYSDAGVLQRVSDQLGSPANGCF